MVVILDRKQFDPYKVGMLREPFIVRLLLKMTWPPVTLRSDAMVTVLENDVMGAKMQALVLKVVAPIYMFELKVLEVLRFELNEMFDKVALEPMIVGISAFEAVN